MAPHDCCQSTENGQVNKGIKQIRTQTGEEVTLTSIEYDDNCCTEYIINYKPFSFKKWLLWFIFFNVASYLAGLHTQNAQIMTVLLCVVVVVLVFKLNVKVCQESLLVSSNVGVQLTTYFVSGRVKSQFYDITEVEDIVINEGITLHQVIFYLTLILSDVKYGKKLVPVYSHCWPCLDCLQQIYRDVQRILHPKQS